MEGEAVVPGPDGCLDPPVPDEADPVEQLVTQGLSEPAHHEVAEAQANGEDQPDGPDMHPAAGPEPSSADGQPEVGYSELLEGMRNAAAITEAPSTQDDTPSNTGAAPVDGEQTTAQQSEVEQEAADQPQAEEGAKKRRRSRFGPAVGSEPDKPAEANSAKKESKATEDGATGEGGDTADEKPRKRRSRWTDKEPEKPLAIVNVKDSKEVITKFPKDITLPGGIKVKMPATVTGEQPHVNPEIRKCYEELAKISRKLLLNEYDMPPEGDPNRSPSPTPVYDKNGVRLNTREVRYREKMMDRRTDLIEELMSMDPEYRPPPDYRPRKIHRKVFIPQKDNPGCNYIGLIIGPRGNTQQRMQRETNCKIAIRGRGSLKEGAPRDPKFDYGEDEDLHVLITGDRKEDVDRAVAEIEDLLQPMDEARLEQKRLQLRELAALNGTLKDEQACFKCGELGHRAYECPQNQMELYQLPEQLQHKVDALYQRDVARVHGVDVGNADDEYKSFLAELGGDRPQDGPEARPSGPGSFRGASGGGMGDGGRFSGGGGGRSFRGDDVPDECKLYVGNLPHAVNDGTLRSMFEPFGTVLSASVVLEQGTGQSRGFGFVHMTDVDVVMAAAAAMNGKVVDGRPLSVRQKSSGPPPPRARFSGGMREPEDCKVYATYLPQSVTESELASLFSRYGSVTSCNHITDRTTGESKGYAFIVMSSPGEAMAAVKGLNGHNMDGRDITVRLAAERPGGPGSRGMPPAGAGRVPAGWVRRRAGPRRRPRCAGTAAGRRRLRRRHEADAHASPHAARHASSPALRRRPAAAVRHASVRRPARQPRHATTRWQPSSPVRPPVCAGDAAARRASYAGLLPDASLRPGASAAVRAVALRWHAPACRKPAFTLPGHALRRARVPPANPRRAWC